MKMLKDKRAAEYLYMYIFYTIFIIFILAALIYWTNDIAKDEDFKRKVIAKQLSLILDTAVPDTEINFQTENVSITIEGEKIIVKKKLEFSYGFYNSYVNFLEKKQDGVFLLKVL